MMDIHSAAGRCSRVVEYDGTPRNGGTCWRIYGRDADGNRTIGIGIEAYQDRRSQRWITLCTAMVEKDKSS